MTNLLVSIPKVSTTPYLLSDLNKRSIFDIEILLPNSITNLAQISILEQIIKTDENHPCAIKYGISDKQNKTSITVVFIVRIEACGTFSEYQLCLDGKICSDYKGEEAIIKTWTFLKTYSDATVQQQAELLAFQNYNNSVNCPLRFTKLF